VQAGASEARSPSAVAPRNLTALGRFQPTRERAIEWSLELLVF
jgi:hypothetical protein